LQASLGVYLLTGKAKGLLRYRINDYRTIYSFNEKELWILVVQIAYRKEIYQDY
jgi:mRNA-degrading endonuclease RelE of RelBE toxin-antitoxin system